MLAIKESHHGATSTKDFFISYSAADSKWAQWIAFQLEAEGYSVILPEWDFRPGMNSVLELHKAVSISERTIAVISPHYVATLHTLPDWAAAFKRDVSSEQQLLLLIIVQPCDLEGLLKQLTPVDLTGLDQGTASERLLSGIKGERPKPKMAPRFPGETGDVFGLLPQRNPLFVGREDALRRIYQASCMGNIVAITPAIDVDSTRSIGKTAIALEYVYRNQCEYDAILWVQDDPEGTSQEAMFQHLRMIVEALGLPSSQSQELDRVVQDLRSWLENNTNWLLVLDGMRDLQIVQALVPSLCQGHVLITSRTRLMAAIAQLIELEDRSQDDKALSEKLAHLVHAALHGLNGQYFHLGLDDITIGSASDNAICLKDPSVAPHHAVVRLRNETYELLDLRSLNGTFVNKQRIPPEVPYPLRQEDNIRVGNVWLAYGSDAVYLASPLQQKGATDTTSTLLKSLEANLLAQEQHEVPAVQYYTPPPLGDVEQILRRARQGNVPNSWVVFHGKLPPSHLARRDLESLSLTSLILGGFLLFSSMLLVLLYMAGNITLPFLVVLCLNVAAIALFALTMVIHIKKPPHPEMTQISDALLILTPEGFVEYIDRSEAIDSVAYADLAGMVLQRDEEDMPWVDLSYRNGNKGEWSQRAYFGPPTSILQNILEMFIDYTRHYSVTER